MIKHIKSKLPGLPFKSCPAFICLETKDVATHKNLLGANKVSVRSFPTPQFAFLLLAHV